MFVTGRPFKPSVQAKPGAYPRMEHLREPERYSTQVGTSTNLHLLD